MKISVLLLLALSAVGIGLIFASSGMAEFTDAQRAVKLMAMEPPRWGMSDEGFNRTWHEQMDALRTSKFAVHDLGGGLVAAGVLFLALVAWKRASLPAIVRSARSPSSVPGFLKLLVLSWLLVIPSFVYTLLRDLGRHEFPWWADSVSIALAGTPLLLVPLPFLMAIGYVLVRSAPLPVRLWAWDPDKGVRSWMSAVAFGALAALTAFAALRSCADGDVFAMPGALIGTYLAFSIRAAMVGKARRPASSAGSLPPDA